MRILAIVFVIGILSVAASATWQEDRAAFVERTKNSMSELRQSIAGNASAAEIKARVLAVHATVWADAWKLALEKMADRIKK